MTDDEFNGALDGRHPSVLAVTQFFSTDHLARAANAEADVAREIADEFKHFALHILDKVRLDGPELTVALRKLLEAKDAAVRSAVLQHKAAAVTQED